MSHTRCTHTARAQQQGREGGRERRETERGETSLLNTGRAMCSAGRERGREREGEGHNNLTQHSRHFVVNSQLPHSLTDGETCAMVWLGWVRDG